MTDSSTLRKGTETFRPRARLVSVLGDQLIRDATVGLLELVKNGYDAAADHVTVKLLNLADSKTTTIIVEDDGDGMDLDTVLYKWLEPATGHKEEDKKDNKRNRKGRLPLGEKGVGRFAAHKLGKELTLISRARNEQGKINDTEVVVNINWEDFEKPDKYLHEIGVTYEERIPEHFLTGSGTYMEMRQARLLWKKQDVERVSRALRRLMSPFKTPHAFSVSLHCPEFPQLVNLDTSELLNTAHAHILIFVDEFGKAEYEYEFKLPPYPTRKFSDALPDLRPSIDKDLWNPPNRKATCGPFIITLYIWDRKPTSLELSKTTRDDLNPMNGIAVFRDGIRVMPYGEPDDDWLDIDKERYMTSSEAFSRKNVVGAVEIDQATNPDLKDKSNREGFIENKAYQDFYLLLRTAIKTIAFNEFSEDRQKIRDAEEARKKELTPAITQLERSVEQITNALQKTRKMADSFVQEGKLAPGVANQILADLTQSNETIALAIQETKQAAIDTLTSFDEEREMLLALAGLGLAAERFTHEFARLTREASDLLQDVEKSPEIQRVTSLKTRVEALSVTLEALRDLVLALGPMFYIRRRTSEKELDVKTIVEHALLLNQGQIKDNKIQVHIDTPQGALLVKMRRGALTQVFNNLIDNSCYWLSRKSEENDRHLRIIILADERAVVVADNGMGIHPKDRHRIFDVFFSTKTEGRGLGLFITREALAEAMSTIVLLEPGEYSTFRVGAAFKIQFPEES